MWLIAAPKFCSWTITFSFGIIHRTELCQTHYSIRCQQFVRMPSRHFSLSRATRLASFRSNWNSKFINAEYCNMCWSKYTYNRLVLSPSALSPLYKLPKFKTIRLSVNEIFVFSGFRCAFPFFVTDLPLKRTKKSGFTRTCSMINCKSDL